MTFSPPLTAEPRFLRINEACEQFRISRSHLYELAKEGGIRIRKLGGRSLVTTADFQRLLVVEARSPKQS